LLLFLLWQLIVVVVDSNPPINEDEAPGDYFTGTPFQRECSNQVHSAINWSPLALHLPFFCPILIAIKIVARSQCQFFGFIMLPTPNNQNGGNICVIKMKNSGVIERV